MQALRTSAALVVLLIGAGGTEASADFEEGTVGRLREHCLVAERAMREDDLEDVYSAALCTGYIAGMTNVLAVNCLDESYQGKYAATTESVGQAVRAFLLWADEHPEHWGRHWGLAVAGIASKLTCRR
jgi:hypothetical protein